MKSGFCSFGKSWRLWRNSETQNNASAGGGGGASLKIPRRRIKELYAFNQKLISRIPLSFCFLIIAFWGLRVMIVVFYDSSQSFWEWLQKQYRLLAVTYPNMVCELILSVLSLIPVLSTGFLRQGPKMVEAIIKDGCTGASDM